MFSPDGNLYKTMSTIFDVIVIGIMWFLASLLLVTLPAATTAAYYTMAKVVRFKSGYLLKDFWKSFRQNFKQSIIPGIIFVLVVVVLVVDIYYVWNNRSQLNDAMFIILAGISFLFLSCSVYFCPFLSRFTKKNMQLFRMSAISAFRFLPITILILVVFIVMVVGIYLMPWAIVVFPGIYLFLLTYPMEYVMRRFMIRPKKGEPGYDAWYWGTRDDEHLPEVSPEDAYAYAAARRENAANARAEDNIEDEEINPEETEKSSVEASDETPEEASDEEKTPAEAEGKEE